MSRASRLRAYVRETGDFLKFAVRRSAVSAPPPLSAGDQSAMVQALLGLSSERMEPLNAVEMIPVVNACLGHLQGAVTSLPLRFYRGDSKEPLKAAPGNPAHLFSYANPEDTGNELMDAIVGSMGWHGTGYVFLDYELTPTIQSLWCLRPDTVTPITDGRKRRITHYEIDTGKGRPEIVMPSQILRFPLYSPRGGYEGLSPLTVLQLAYETQRDVGRWTREFYRKGALLSGFFSTDSGIGEKEEDRVVGQLRLKYQGLRNSFNPVILPRNLKYQAAGSTLKDMAIPETLRSTAWEVMAMYRVPPVIMGIKEGGGLSDAGAITDLMIWWGSAIPWWTNRIAATINERLLGDLLHASEFGAGDLRCEFDFSGVTFLNQAKLEMLSKGLPAAGNVPVLSPNDLRRMAGLPPSPKPEHDEIPEKEAPVAPQQPLRDGESGRDKGMGHGRHLPAAASEGEREVVAARQDARVSVQERYMAKGVRRLGRQQEGRVVEWLARTHGAAAAAVSERAAIDPLDILSATAADRRLLRAYMRAVLTNAAYQELADLGLKVGFRVGAERVVRWLGEREEVAVVGTTRVTRAALAESLGAGVRAQETYAELVARVREVFRERYYGQSNAIVRTETMAAYNFGANEAWAQTNEAAPGTIEGREWITARDDRVREEHVEADGQFAPLGEPFTVGGERLMFPGDHSLGASAENVINCRCTAVPKLAEKNAALLRPEARADTIACVGDLFT